ncbi:hypothetical protein VNI00_015848 [Paramarasmius palmivorus]|uniref:Uncharacterized protein n=1 Tax=Paramarasmius palmivorus TaxID=297713 RepID=A0AAW0BHU7_9AGAR
MSTPNSFFSGGGSGPLFNGPNFNPSFNQPNSFNNPNLFNAQGDLIPNNQLAAPNLSSVDLNWKLIEENMEIKVKLRLTEKRIAELEEIAETRIKEKESLETKYKRLRDDFEELRADYRDCREELKDKEEEIRRYQEEEEDTRSRKRRRDNHSPTPTESTSHSSDSHRLTVNNLMDPDPIGDGYYRSQPQLQAALHNKSLGLPVSITDERGKRLPLKFFLPDTLENVQFELEELNKSTTTRPRWQFAKKYLHLHRKIRYIKSSDRTEIQRYVFDHFHLPEWAQSLQSSEERQPINTLPAPNVTGTKTAKNVEFGPHGPPPLRHDASIDEITAHQLHARATERYTKFGIHFRNDGAVSMRSIRGYRFIQLRCPKYSRNHPGLTVLTRNRFMFIHVELALTPGYYATRVGTNILPDSLPSEHPLDCNNLTVDTLADFYINQGVTVAELEDAAGYAAHWLASFICTNQINVQVEIADLRAKLQPLIDAQGIPSGINDDYRFPDGTIEHHVSTTIFLFNLIPSSVVPTPSQPSQSTGMNNMTPTTTDEDHTMEDQSTITTSSGDSSGIINATPA